MDDHSFLPNQPEIIQSPIAGKYFLEGPAGSGKTTATITRLGFLLNQIPGHQMLIFVPQRSLGKPYYEFLSHQKNYAGTYPSIQTFGGFAKRMIELFWPLMAHDSGFAYPHGKPFFLTMETAQYCMDQVVQPFIKKGFFQSVIMEKSRLFSQILDNLNKAAVVDFPLSSISHRLRGVDKLDASMEIAYEQVQICAQAFREFCFQHNLIDYSLLMQLFQNSISNKSFFHQYFEHNFQLIIADNLEEDIPIFHDFLKTFLPKVSSAWLVYDHNGGFRSFLGADPSSAHSLKQYCDQIFSFEKIYNHIPALRKLNLAMEGIIQFKKIVRDDADFNDSLLFKDYRFYPEMIALVCQQVQDLIINQHVMPKDIVILSPYLSDALNFSLSATLGSYRIPVGSFRPSRQYQEEPVVRTLLSLAKLAHPQWNLSLSRLELREMLLCCLRDLDIVRADLITRTLYNPDKLQEGIRSFDSITNLETQERITYRVGEGIEKIRTWLSDYQSAETQPLDIFISRIYGELLSQSGMQFFDHYEWAETVSHLISSIKYFRFFSTFFLEKDEINFGIDYIRSIQAGLLPSAFFRPEDNMQDAVLISPAHSFLMQNRQVAYQFWLDIGNLGWWERLNQPLTNPYLLNRHWDATQKWTVAHEYAANQASMRIIVQGLLSRCSRQIVACSVRMNEYGSEQRGPLLRAFQSLRKQIYHLHRRDHV